MNERIIPGFVYSFELFSPDGKLIDAWTEHNVMPVEGMNYILEAAFRDGTKQPQWYCALYEGNYTPTGLETAATFASATAECTTYSETARPAFTSAAASSGGISNIAARAEFTSTSDKTIYGGALLSSNVKGGSGGVLASIVRFPTAKPFLTGGVLRATAGFQFVSA